MFLDDALPRYTVDLMKFTDLSSQLMWKPSRATNDTQMEICNR